MKLEDILKALGVTTADDGIAAITDFNKFLSTVREATGAKSFSDCVATIKGQAEALKQFHELTGKAGNAALAVVAAWKLTHEAEEKASAELAQLKDKTEQGEIKSLLDTATAEGRLVPAKREEMEQAYAKYGPDWVRAFVAALPKQVQIGSKDGRKPAPPVTEPTALSDEDEEVRAALGITAEQYLKNLKDYAAHGGAAE